MRRPLSSARCTVLAALALLTGCGLLAGCADTDVDGEPLRRGDERPGIDVAEARCGPVEVVPMGRAERFQPLPGGELYLVGNHYNRYRRPAGRVVQFDPTGHLLPLDLRIGWPVRAMAMTERGLVTGRDAGGVHRWPPGDFDEAEELFPPYGDGALTGLDLLWPTSDAIILARLRPTLIGDGIPQLMRLDLRTREPQWARDVTVADAGQYEPIISGRIRSLILEDPRPGTEGEVLAVGTAYVPMPRVPADAPRDWFGFSMRVDAQAGWRTMRRIYPQEVFEPMRLVADRFGRSVVLAVEGHRGDRYAEARPFVARIAPDGALVDRIPVPLPDGTRQGALLAAWPLDDGWLLGGSACGESRQWCQAWVLRVDRDWRVMWSRLVGRDVAATVTDLWVRGHQVLAAISSSSYCCQFTDFDYDAWLWELTLDGHCPSTPGIQRDGAVFR